MSRTSWTTDQALPRLASAMSPRLSRRNIGVRRSIRPGFAAISTPMITTSTAGSTHRPPSMNRAGSASCNPIMTTMASANGHRCSPRVIRRQAGRAASSSSIPTHPSWRVRSSS